ncbi:MAG: YgiQ family radical SAM protein [Rectinemataceae bacterium]
MSFLPAWPADLSREQVLALAAGEGPFDFIFVSGDAYVDHPTFAAAILGRLLETRGFFVGILARPDPDDVGAFRLLGKPRLAWLVSAGALDSMVSSYTANRKPRSEDDYAPGGNPETCLRSDGSLGPGMGGRKNARPDRAVISYAGRCREAYKGVPVIVGGIEASLRRFAHYDYWSDTVRRSVLLDSKAELLVYGMGEAALLEIAGRLRGLAASGPKDSLAFRAALRGIRGTCSWTSRRPEMSEGPFVELPSWELAAKADEAGFAAFNESFRLSYLNAEAGSGARLVEESGGRFVIQEPPAPPLAGAALDELYELCYSRKPHPMYEGFGGVPALSEVAFSLVSNRGCFGGCSFCAIALHQGRTVTARTVPSLVREAGELVKHGEFKGYIHDLGGPTANFMAPACPKMARAGACPERRCLTPEPCPRLVPDHRDFVAALQAVRAVPGVKKVFVRSGIRFDYLLLDTGTAALEEIVAHHVSGQLKIAPEHVSDRVLALMGKPGRAMYDVFTRRYAELNARMGLRQYMIPYFISAHPGAGLSEAIELAEYLRDSGFVPDQVQDFYPTPGTLATAMYRTGRDPMSGEEVHVARGEHERSLQRALLQFNKPGNATLVREALRREGRGDLIGSSRKCLVEAS